MISLSHFSCQRLARPVLSSSKAELLAAVLSHFVWHSLYSLRSARQARADDGIKNWPRIKSFTEKLPRHRYCFLRQWSYSIDSHGLASARVSEPNTHTSSGGELGEFVSTAYRNCTQTMPPMAWIPKSLGLMHEML